MAKTVCIDSGHYAKYNRCPSNPKYYESEVMWKLHLLQKKYLEQLGIKVITTRSDLNKDLSLYSRGATSKGCDLFISDHSNAVGSGMNETVDYVAVYHLTDDKNVKCDDISKEVADKIAPVIADVMEVQQGYRILTRLSDFDSNYDGIMNDNYYGVLNGSRQVGTAGLIIEHGFHTHSKTVEWLLKDANLDKLARAEAECIASYLLGKTVSLKTTIWELGKYNLNKKLHIRKKPNIAGKSIRTLKKGSTVEISKISGNWGYVELFKGWICLKKCTYLQYKLGRYKLNKDLWLRQSASTKGKTIKKLKKGTVVDVIQKQNTCWGYTDQVGWICLKNCIYLD